MGRVRTKALVQDKKETSVTTISMAMGTTPKHQLIMLTHLFAAVVNEWTLMHNGTQSFTELREQLKTSGLWQVAVRMDSVSASLSSEDVASDLDFPFWTWFYPERRPGGA